MALVESTSDDPAVRAAETQRLWQGEPSGSYPACVSPYGVVDLVGNVEEWVSTSRPEWPHRSSLKGGYWSKPWAGCRGDQRLAWPDVPLLRDRVSLLQGPGGGDVARTGGTVVLSLAGRGFAGRREDHRVPLPALMFERQHHFRDGVRPARRAAPSARPDRRSSARIRARGS
ncbi:SUMF1/EgtB/PvdO family nonheme iron enzyme [Sorangium sp. So ce1128]